MSPRRIAIVGSGQRVVETALPVLETLRDRFELAGVFSRTPKTIESAGRAFTVEGLDALDVERMATIDALYLVVSKGAVPSVLARLAATGAKDVDLLIETPVLLPRHMVKTGVLRAFRTASVTEDCLTLPLVDAARACVASGSIGALREVVLDRSAYAYHGIAMLKAFFGGAAIRSARRVTDGDGGWRRTYRFAGGGVGRTVDPRDYSRGRILLRGDRGTLADHELDAGQALRLEVALESDVPVGIRAGEGMRPFDENERVLMGSPKDGVTPWAWMDGMKRVGFRRLLLGLADGRPAYPVLQALDDALVDYHLEKVGRYLANPASSARGVVMRGIARGVRPGVADWHPDAWTN